MSRVDLPTDGKPAPFGNSSGRTAAVHVSIPNDCQAQPPLSQQLSSTFATAATRTAAPSSGLAQACVTAPSATDNLAIQSREADALPTRPTLASPTFVTSNPASKGGCAQQCNITYWHWVFKCNTGKQSGKQSDSSHSPSPPLPPPPPVPGSNSSRLSLASLACRSTIAVKESVSTSSEPRPLDE